MKLSIIVPAHNEEDNIVEVIKRIEDSVLIEHELVVVNDHSTDKTFELVEQLAKVYKNLVLVDNKLEGGFANTICTGFSCSSGELLVPVMADLCDDLSTIQAMYERINQGYDIVCGSRYILGGKRIGGSKLKGFLSSFAGSSLHYLLGVPTSDIANAFKMYKRDVLDKIEIKSKAFEVSMEIPLKAYYLGFKITEVPTLWKERAKGKSSFKMFKLLPSYFKLYAWAIFRRLRG